MAKENENMVPVIDTNENVTLLDGEIAILASGTHIMNIATYFDFLKRAKKFVETERDGVTLDPATTNTTLTPEQRNECREGMRRLAKAVLDTKEEKKDKSAEDVEEFKKQIPRYLKFSRALSDYRFDPLQNKYVFDNLVYTKKDWDKLASTIILDSEGNLFVSKKAAEMYHGLPKSTVSKIAADYPTMMRAFSRKLNKYVTFRAVDYWKAYPWTFGRWAYGLAEDKLAECSSFVLSDKFIDLVAEQSSTSRSNFISKCLHSNLYYDDLIRDMKGTLENLEAGARNAR